MGRIISFPSASKSFPSRLSGIVLLAAAVMLSLFACRASDPEPAAATISFDRLFDDLVGYDLVRITLKSSDGHTLDQPFYGKVVKASDLQNLAAPHWDGGPVTVSIIGYKADVIAYRAETEFNGKTNQKGETRVFVAPGMSLTAESPNIAMVVGDSAGLPVIHFLPAALADKSLTWTSTGSEVLLLGETFLKALGPGISKVTARLNADPKYAVEVTVTVTAQPLMPEQLILTRDTLYLAAGGAALRAEARLLPANAVQSIRWQVADSGIATVDAEGLVRGLKDGITVLRAVSAPKPLVFDTAILVVAEHVDVERVRFLKETTEIFLGGAAEVLQVEVLPAKANPEVVYSTRDTALIVLKDGRIGAKAVGEASVIAASKENLLIADTLKIKVSTSQFVDSVHLDQDTLFLFTGGDAHIITGRIIPSTTLQKIQWLSGNADVATVNDAGKVNPVAPGKTKVYAISVADSLKRDSVEVIVKTDAPVITVGRDTVIFVGETALFNPVVAQQEFGKVVKFKWDLDGIPGWEDSTDAVKPLFYTYTAANEYTARFQVRDTEGNEGIASKKVTVMVDTVKANGQVALLSSLKIDGVEMLTTPDTRLFNLPEYPHEKKTMKFEATTVMAGAIITFNNADWIHTLSQTVDLRVGANNWNLKVLGTDGITSRIYFVAFDRKRNFLMAKITPSVGTLSPAFSPTVNAYKMLLPGQTTDILKFTLEPQDTSNYMAMQLPYTTFTGLRSGENSHEFFPQIGISTYSIGVSDSYWGDSLANPYKVDVCTPGFKLMKSKTLQYDAVFSPGISMTTDGTDAYIAMVDAYVGGKATLWKIADTTVTVLSTGYTPKINALAVAKHGGDIITAYAAPAPIGVDSTKLTFVSGNGAVWNAHSELPRNVYFQSRFDLVSFDNRLIALTAPRWDTSIVYEYKSNAWVQLGAKDVGLLSGRFFKAGSNLYYAGVSQDMVHVRKLGVGGFVKVGEPFSIAPLFMDDEISLSETGTGAPILAIGAGSYPNKVARTYRLQGGAWTLSQEFATNGNMDGISLLRTGNKLMLYYDNAGTETTLYLDEATAKWVAGEPVESGSGGNIIQSNLIRTTSGVYLLEGYRECITISKLYDCAGY